MRSSPSSRRGSKADPLDPGSAGFAHRGLHGPGVPENSLPAFAAAIRAGAGIECDLRLSADGIPLVFHDRDAARLCGNPVVLSAAPAERLSALRLAETGEGIPALADLLGLVAGRVPLLLELKIERNVPRFSAAVVAALADYDGPVGVMSFAAGVGRWLRLNAPRVRRGLVVSERVSPLARWARIRRADPHFLAVKRTEIGKPWLRAARAAMPVYCWTVRTADERGSAAVHADALIWEANGRP